MTIYQVDAFTSDPFAGNPAAICVLGEPRSAEWMQDVAREMNLSETAFLMPHDVGYHLRWFTPSDEVDLCGHATLAAAHVLWQTDQLDAGEPAFFHTRSGRLTATLQDGWIEMDFPAEPVEAAAAPDGLARALATEPVYVGKNRLDYLVLLDTEDAVRRLAPDMNLLATVEARGLIVTAPADGASYDFVSRYFAPQFGIPEDPVTGSAHCALGPFWAERLGHEALTGYQASTRGGTVRVRPHDDRVILAGQAVTTLQAELLV